MEEQFLYDQLISYTSSEAYPFHMPGHKRRLGGMADPVSFDITEIDGFDNLHHPQGILLEAQRRAARLYGAEETFFLVNGSTSGILTAVSASCQAGAGGGRGGILMARNSHQSAFHAVYLRDLDPVWLYPEKAELFWAGDAPEEEDFAGAVNGRIGPEAVDRQLSAHPKIGTVFIVSPTYDGVISDIRAIAAATHRHGAVLIVDEAHGACYGMAPGMPESAVSQGADLVIHSLHKTMPALTQTALLHVNGSLADPDLVRRFLRIYQTSSPSYVLMASMDQCIRMMEQRRESLFSHFLGMLDRFYESVRGLRVLRVGRSDDASRILIFSGTGRLSGGDICAILRKNYGLELEMAAPAYALALASVGDDEEGLVRLSQALREMDEELFIRERFGGYVPKAAGLWQKTEESILRGPMRAPEKVMTIRAAWDGRRVSVPLEDAAGETVGEFVFLYPPGVPLLLPGERIDRSQITWMRELRKRGFSLQGMRDQTMEQIMIVAGAA